MSWEIIIGQNKAKALLREQMHFDRVSHAYLFIGPEGVGKRMTAEVFGRALNCSGEKKPCDVCLSCKQILHGNGVNINYLAPAGQKIKLEELQPLIKGINYKTQEAAAQILIIDGADKMTPAAANYMLKTLEEPPVRTHFILLAEEKAAVLPTILSRCQTVLFTPINPGEAAEFIGDKLKLTPELALSYVKLAQGSIGKAQSIARDEGFQEIRAKAEEIFDFKSNDAYDILKLSTRMEVEKEHIQEILEMLRLLLRDGLVWKVDAHKLIINADKIELFAKQEHSFDELLRQYKIVDETVRRLKANANRRLALDVMFLSLKWDGRKSA